MRLTQQHCVQQLTINLNPNPNRRSPCLTLGLGHAPYPNSTACTSRHKKDPDSRIHTFPDLLSKFLDTKELSSATPTENEERTAATSFMNLELTSDKAGLGKVGTKMCELHTLVAESALHALHHFKLRFELRYEHA